MREPKKPSQLSRRNFPQAVGKAGGAVAVHETMTALGHHTAVLDYCKHLGVRLEMDVMSNRALWNHGFPGDKG